MNLHGVRITAGHSAVEGWGKAGKVGHTAHNPNTDTLVYMAAYVRRSSFLLVQHTAVVA